MLPQLLLTVVCVVTALVGRSNPLVMSAGVSGTSVLVTSLVVRLGAMGTHFVGPIVVATTRYRRRQIRVSIAYLIGVVVDGHYLLLRGNRIEKQFQPVGGAFKARGPAPYAYANTGAVPEVRPNRPAEDQEDLRLRMKGRDLPRLLVWFKSGHGRECLPIREFYEELIDSGMLDPTTFRSIDLSYRGRQRSGLALDTYSGLPQLIVAEIYELVPTSDQLAELRALRSRTAPVPGAVDRVYFAPRAEIEQAPSLVRDGSVEFDLAPTCAWLVL